MKKAGSLKKSIIIGCVVSTIILALAVSILNYFSYRRAFFEDYRVYIDEVLALTLNQIDNDDLKKCADTVQESEKFYQLRDHMDYLMDNMDIHALYVLRPIEDENGKGAFSIIGGEKTYDRINNPQDSLWLGYVSYDGYDDETIDQLFEIMKTDETVYFYEETEWGNDYTGAVTLRDSNGEAYGILAVDIEMSSILSVIMECTLRNVLLVFAVGAVFVIVFTLWADRKIATPIKRLNDSVNDYSQKCDGVRDAKTLEYNDPHIHTNNEIETLSDAVISMAESIDGYIKDTVMAEKRAENMEQIANMDALTHVRNKAAYDSYVKGMERDLAFEPFPFGIAMIDLNNLKRINDGLGHEKGDYAIKKLCNMICGIFKHSPVFRIGGDEFVVIIRGKDYETKDNLIAVFRNRSLELSKNIKLEPWERISAALGYAEYDPQMDDGVLSVFKRADQEMYTNKKIMKDERREFLYQLEEKL